MRNVIAGLLFGVVIVSAGSAQAAPRLSSTVADEVLQKSGMVLQLAQIEPSIQGGINLNPALSAKVTEAQLAGVHTAIATAFATDKLVSDAKVQITETLAPDIAMQALVWLNSDLGRRISALEDEAGKFEGFQEREAAAAELFKRLPERRIDRYIQLAKATQAGEGGATVAIDTTLATARGIASLVSDAPDKNLDAVKAQLDANRPQLVQSMEQEFTVLFAGAYATLDDKEIDQYIAFSESPAGAAYNTALIKVMDAVMSHAAMDAGRLIAASRANPPSSGT